MASNNDDNGGNNNESMYQRRCQKVCALFGTIYELFVVLKRCLKNSFPLF